MDTDSMQCYTSTHRSILIGTTNNTIYEKYKRLFSFLKKQHLEVHKLTENYVDSIVVNENFDDIVKNLAIRATTYAKTIGTMALADISNDSQSIIAISDPEGNYKIIEQYHEADLSEEDKLMQVIKFKMKILDAFLELSRKYESNLKHKELCIS